jgi:D-glycero-alpha-D-manno-heptose-7-phosphate kinase
MSRRVARGIVLTENYNCDVRISASAPTRIDLAGGTIDIWPLYLFHAGAQTLNAAISLRARAWIEARPDERIELVSEDTDKQENLSFDQLPSSDATLPLLAKLTHRFGARGIRLTTRGESPAGAGIAGSSAMNVAICGALARLQKMEIDPEALLDIARDVEAQVIKVPTGVQDYRPAMYGGVAAVELHPGHIRRVPLDVDAGELERRIVLCYTGEPRNSGTNNWEITKRHIDGDAHIFDCFERIRDTAVQMREALTRGDWDQTAAALATEWENRKRLAPGVTTPAIDQLIARASAAGAKAAKVCGAGGGGCMFCLAEPDDVAAVRDALAEAGARLLDFRIETTGLEVSGA